MTSLRLRLDDLTPSHAHASLFAGADHLQRAHVGYLRLKPNEYVALANALWEADYEADYEADRLPYQAPTAADADNRAVAE